MPIAIYSKINSCTKLWCGVIYITLHMVGISFMHINVKMVDFINNQWKTQLYYVRRVYITWNR